MDRIVICLLVNNGCSIHDYTNNSPPFIYVTFLFILFNITAVVMFLLVIIPRDRNLNLFLWLVVLLFCRRLLPFLVQSVNNVVNNDGHVYHAV